MECRKKENLKNAPARMRAAIKQVCAANVSLIICRQGNCPAAASRQKSKKPTTAASRPSQRRGNCKNMKRPGD